MHRPPEASPRPPGDFAATLDTPEPLLLVGGQAVNLWALYYESRTQALAPFVSLDADVLGDRETLSQIAQVIGCRPQFFPLKPPSNEVGVVFAHTSTGETMMIEVLRSVYGVTNDELRESVFEMALGAKPVRVLVPGPVSLLKAKIANAADLPQAGRQDARHVAILLELMPAFLADLASSVPKGRMSERDFIDRVESLLAVITTAKARRVLAALGVPPPRVFEELNEVQLPKLESFLKKRLPRLLAE